jgi:PAS domain S-box-containing protein
MTPPENAFVLPLNSSLDTQLFESSPDCVKILGLAGEVLAMNHNGLCAMEIDCFDELAGKPWRSMWPQESHQAVDLALSRALEGQSARFTGLCATGKGTLKWWEVVVTPVLSATGDIQNFLSVSRDVTASYAAQAALQTSEARFRSLVNATSSIVWSCPAQGTFDAEQLGWAEYTGQSFEEYTGAGWLNAVHPDDRPMTAGKWRTALETLGVYEVEHRLRRADGQYRSMAVRGIPIMGNDGAVIEWVGIHTDITAEAQASAERERLLKEVRAANDRVLDVFMHAPAFICVLRGPDHVFELINEQYRQLVGNRDVVGQSIRQALPEVEGQGFFELLDRVYSTGETFRGIELPVKLQRVPGAPLEERSVDLVYIPLRDAEGMVTGLLVHGVDQTHRKHAQSAQTASQERLLLATEAAELGLFCWNPVDDTVVWENDRQFEIFGLPTSAPPLSAAVFRRDFLHPDDAAAFDKTVQATFDDDCRMHFQGRFFRADGQLRWIEFAGRALMEKPGQPRELVGTTRDITAGKHAEIGLFESRERLAKIVNQAATGVVEADAQGHITLVNQRFCDMLGLPEAEVLGASLLDVTAPGSMAITRAGFDSLVDGGNGFVIDKQYRRGDGSLLWATSSVNPLRSATGEFQGLVAIVLDTTVARQAAEALRMSEERYRTLFETMDQGFCTIQMIFDESGKPIDYQFIDMNTRFESNTGLAGAAGRRVRELVPDLDQFWFDVYGRVALTGEPVRFENEAKAMGRWFEVHATRIGEADSRQVAIFFRDTTVRKNAEEGVRKLAADLTTEDRRKTEFLATLAHELRNPLAPIRNSLSLLRLGGDSPASVARVRELMERQVAQMVRLIDDLLDVARISGGKLLFKKELVELNKILSTAVETSLPLIEASGHELIVNVTSDSLPLLVDPTRVAQVIANLLNNAAKYTPAGGKIQLSAQRVGTFAEISVLDSGIGIPPDALGSIFEMFSQVSRNMDHAQGGLGIGLSLVKNLVEMQGGVVSAVSAGPGTGSTFTVRLPLATTGTHAHPNDAPALPSNPGMASRGRKILVVDDNIDAAKSLTMILDIIGHRTEVAVDGPQAIRTARSFTPEIAFLDIGMPGMSGYELARVLRAAPELSGITLVALTGWGADTDRMRSKAAGFDHHLVKPVDMKDIEQLLEGLGSEGKV